MTGQLPEHLTFILHAFTHLSQVQFPGPVMHDTANPAGNDNYLQPVADGCANAKTILSAKSFINFTPFTDVDVTIRQDSVHIQGYQFNLPWFFFYWRRHIIPHPALPNPSYVRVRSHAARYPAPAAP